jgi:cyclopropane fatty-acyl-phospholipid synthase-like methyltransferase
MRDHREAKVPPDRVNQVNLSLFGLADGARILDLGCARGEQSILLAERGLEVVGADTDPALLDVSTKEATARGVTVTA